MLAMALAMPCILCPSDSRALKTQYSSLHTLLRRTKQSQFNRSRNLANYGVELFITFFSRSPETHPPCSSPVQIVFSCNKNIISSDDLIQVSYSNFSLPRPNSGRCTSTRPRFHFIFILLSGASTYLPAWKIRFPSQASLIPNERLFFRSIYSSWIVLVMSNAVQLKAHCWATGLLIYIELFPAECWDKSFL